MRATSSRAPAWRRLARAVAELPLGVRVALFVAALVHGCGLSWGMPASDAWDNDGIAPRDILPGLAETFTPGEFYTYPPAQLVLLTLLTLPVTLAAAARAGTTHVPEVIRVILAPSYMTAFTMTARIVCLLMSLGVVLAVALVAHEIAASDAGAGVGVGVGVGGAGEHAGGRARRVATFAALFATVGAPFTYYSHTSNLDVPYLFWGSLGALFFVRAIARREPRLLRRAAAFAALAIATKDQAYALYLFAAPACLAAWALVDPWTRANARRVAREVAVATAIAVAILLVVDGAVTNPSGFRARLRFLSGPASQDYATYSKDLTGRLDNFLDIGKEIEKHYPSFAAIVIVVGLVVAVRGARRAESGSNRLVAALVPLAITLSFTLAFNLVARRVEERFTLPHAIFGAVYAGFALELSWRARSTRDPSTPAPWPTWIGRLVAVGVLAACARESLRVDATMLVEPRYETEAWLRDRASGRTIEIHGLNVYLPRFPPSSRVWRVGHGPVEKRSPLPGVEEIQAPLAAIHERDPDFVVVSGCYVWRYLPRDIGASTGRIYPTTQHRDAGDADATAFFKSLFDWQLGYHLVHMSQVDPKRVGFQPAHIHGSLDCPIFTFERNAP